MVTYNQFCRRCRMRHDFNDQIQVRYQQDDQEAIDTWVSGSEALQRLRSESVDRQIEGLRQLSLDDIKIVIDALPDAARARAERTLRDDLAKRLQETIGGNPVGDALSDSVRGRTPASGDNLTEKERWRALLRHEPFRQKVLELAWRQLEGSLPASERDVGPDDWL